MIRKIILSSLFSLTALVILSSFNVKAVEKTAPQSCATRIIFNNSTKTTIEYIEGRDDDESSNTYEVGHGTRQYIGTFVDPPYMTFELHMPEGHQKEILQVFDMATQTVVDSYMIEGGAATVYMLKIMDPSCKGYYRLEYLP